MGGGRERQAEPVYDIVQPVGLRFLELDADLIEYVPGREIQLGPVFRKLPGNKGSSRGLHCEQPQQLVLAGGALRCNDEIQLPVIVLRQMTGYPLPA